VVVGWCGGVLVWRSVGVAEGWMCGRGLVVTCRMGGPDSGVKTPYACDTRSPLSTPTSRMSHARAAWAVLRGESRGAVRLSCSSGGANNTGREHRQCPHLLSSRV
jgi:hypothetical protein